MDIRKYPLPWGWEWVKSCIPIGFGDEFLLWGWNHDTLTHPVAPLPSVWLRLLFL